MSVEQLGSPVVSGWLEVASESVTAAAAVPRVSLAHAELTDCLGKVAVLESQVAALKCEILAGRGGPAQGRRRDRGYGH